MDPISAMIAAAGLALTISGTLAKSHGAAEQTATQQQEISVEQQQDALRNQIMNLTARREEYQNVRNVQRARSLAMSNAVESGAQFGSGIGGGLGQISGQGGANQLKISQDTQAGNEMFGFTSEMNVLKQQYAQEGGLINTGTGLMGLGAGIMGSQKQLTDLTKFGLGSAQNMNLGGLIPGFNPIGG